MDKEKYIAETKLRDKAKKPPLKFKVHIPDGYISPRMFSSEVELEWLFPILNAKCKEMAKQIAEIRQLVTSYNAHGIALSNNFGSSEDIGMSQRAITEAIRQIKEELHNITGEPDDGICVKVTPDVFVAEGTGLVQVTVTSRSSIFEKVKIYVNDELAIEKNYTTGFMENIVLTETSMIKTVVQIMGVEYTDMKVVTKLFPFFIGSGTTWRDAMTVDNAQTYKGKLVGSYDITVNNDGEKMFIIIPKHLSNPMIKVMMGGFQIPVITHEHDDLFIYESVNEYQAGRYTIDIVCDCPCPCSTAESTEDNN